MKKLLVGLQNKYPSLEAALEETIKKSYDEKVFITYSYGQDFITTMENIINDIKTGIDNTEVTHYNGFLIIEDARKAAEPFYAYMEEYKKLIPGALVIYLLPNDLFGTDLLRDIYDKGLYDGLFIADYSDEEESLIDLIKYPRDRGRALDYYGIVPSDSVKKRDAVINENTRIVNASFGWVEVTKVKGKDTKELISKSFENDPSNDAFLNDYEMNLFRESYATMPEYNVPMIDASVRAAKLRLQDYFENKGRGIYEAFQNEQITRAEFEDEVLRIIKSYDELDSAQKKDLYKSYIAEILSYGMLDILFADPKISDIRLLNKDMVTVQSLGKWYRTNIYFETDNEYNVFLSRICTKNSVSMNRKDALPVFSDTKTCPTARLRFIGTHEMLNSSEIGSLHIRKIPKTKPSAAELIADGLFTKVQANYLIKAIQSGKTILIDGGSGSGKTTLINFLIEYLRDDICGTCIQEADELFSNTLPNIEWQHPEIAKGSDNTESYTLHKVTSSSLLKNCQVTIVGEIKNEEAADIFTACNTGSQCIWSLHGKSVFTALPRMVDLIKRVDDRTQTEILKILTDCVDIVVQMEKYKIKDIALVSEWDAENEDVVYELLNFVTV